VLSRLPEKSVEGTDDLKDVRFCAPPRERKLSVSFATGVRARRWSSVCSSDSDVRREPGSRRRYRPDIATLSRPTERQRPESPGVRNDGDDSEEDKISAREITNTIVVATDNHLQYGHRS
jgi:hypothetical protein